MSEFPRHITRHGQVPEVSEIQWRTSTVTRLLT